jgi:hypothetical protein
MISVIRDPNPRQVSWKPATGEASESLPNPDPWFD